MRRFRLTPLRLSAAILIGSLAFAGVSYAASLGLTSKQLHTWSQALTKGTCSPAESDAEIRGGNPNRNFGNQSSEKVVNRSNVNDWYVLIGFDPASSPCSLPATAGADSAVLTLTITSASKNSVSAYPITSPWNAATVTWNTAPTFGSTPDFTFSGAGTDTFTVTAPLDTGIKSGGSFYGWMLVDTSGTNNATTTIAGNGSGQDPAIALHYEK